eukprot:gnl/MRDRNA2_/MRDRNA2_125681_c0_seq1.p1 gnl/MRDRNA2_/MRDRNA2_125681_c0~~gnl/MRDRNA2_/MRDRNA2_125681_c0_seq1.p1  ORF type:complete len:504 (-),score=69.10 gnl/MRDRNA2_/MRDRNA2_125681_c0_seq1:8-1519(-)
MCASHTKSRRKSKPDSCSASSSAKASCSGSAGSSMTSGLERLGTIWVKFADSVGATFGSKPKVLGKRSRSSDSPAKGTPSPLRPRKTARTNASSSSSSSLPHPNSIEGNGQSAEHILKPCQQKALSVAAVKCEKAHKQGLVKLRRRVKKLQRDPEDVNKLLDHIRNKARIVIHFKPQEIAKILAKDTHYRNQFETNTSNGVRDKTRRASWEESLFDGAYNNAANCERPKYGVLNVVNDPRGVKACSQYGDSYLQLGATVRGRTTLSSEDSSRIAERGGAGVATVCACAHVIDEYTDSELCATLDVSSGRKLGLDSQVIQRYKEVQIHGDVRLDKDVEFVCVHPRHKANKKTRKEVEDMCERHSLPLIWMEELGQIPAPDPPEIAVMTCAQQQQLNVKWRPPWCHRYDCMQITHYSLLVEGSSEDGLRNYCSEKKELLGRGEGKPCNWTTNEVSFSVKPGSWRCQVCAMVDGTWGAWSKWSKWVIVDTASAQKSGKTQRKRKKI